MNTTELFQFLAIMGDRYKDSLMRGVIILGGLYLIFWVFRRPWMDKYRIPTIGSQQAKPLREIFLTLNAYIVYAFGGAMIVLIYQKTGHIMMYSKVSDYGWAYTIFSFFLLLFFIDATFYWSHILMHKYSVLRKAHATHHQFVNVTPFSSYAFHYGEAFINAGSFILLLLVIPWHPMTLLVFLIFTVFYTGMLHLGYDVFPKSWRKNTILKWMNTPTHHVYHHQKSNCNYGFLFTFWDKVMKTEKLPETY